MADLMPQDMERFDWLWLEWAKSVGYESVEDTFEDGRTFWRLEYRPRSLWQRIFNRLRYGRMT